MPAPRWFPDELAHAGAEHLNPVYVATYDRKAGFDPAPDVAWLAGHGLGRSSTVVDLGCGTGTFALAVAGRCARVVAVDVSGVMLDRLRARVDAGQAGNVEPVRAGFLSYEHRGDPADVVYSRNALHQLPDLWKAVAVSRMADLLRPGGVLLLRDLVFSFNPRELESHVEPWLAGAAPSPDAGWTAQEYETHLREEHSTFSWLLEPMLDRAGFDVLEVEHRDSRLYSRYACVRRG